MKKLADGRIYSTNQALKHKLIDGVSTYDDYKDRVEQEVGEGILFYEKDNKNTSLSSLFSTMKQIRGRSDAEVISDLIENKKNGGLMYYESSLE